MEKNMSDDTKQNPEVKESPKPELNEIELNDELSEVDVETIYGGGGKAACTLDPTCCDLEAGK
jgi:hypothetical protein